MEINLEHWNETTDGKLCEENMTNKLQARGYKVTCYVYSGLSGSRYQVIIKNVTLKLKKNRVVLTAITMWYIVWDAY